MTESNEILPEIKDGPPLTKGWQKDEASNADVHWCGLFFVNTVVWTALMIVCVAGSFQKLIILTGVLGTLHYILGLVVYIILRIGTPSGQTHNEITKESFDATLFKTFVWFIIHVLNMGLWGVMLIVLWALHEILVFHLFVVPIFLLDVWFVAKYHEIVQRNSSHKNSKIQN